MKQNIVAYECEVHGLRWIARLVTLGLGYGRWTKEKYGPQTFGPGNWDLVHEEASPMVEFYVETSAQAPLGQFVIRYYLHTLEEVVGQPGFAGMPFDLNNPGWEVTKSNMEKVLQKFVPLAQDAAAQQQRQFKVLLANRGNPDRGQDPQTCLFTAPDDFWLPVPSLDAASAAVRNYLDAFELGGGNWIGGQVIDAGGDVAARISYNGRAFAVDGHTVLQEAADQNNYKQQNEDWFFAQQPVHSAYRSSREVARG